MNRQPEVIVCLSLTFRIRTVDNFFWIRIIDKLEIVNVRLCTSWATLTDKCMTQLEHIAVENQQIN